MGELTTTFDDGAVRIEAASLEAARDFFDRAREESGFLVRLPVSPKLYESLEMAVACGEGFRFEFAARVIQVFERPGAPPPERYGVACQIDGWNEAKTAELARKLRQAEGEAGEEEAPEGEAMGASPIFRIRSMNVSERIRLATKASRTERQILLRDTSPQVLLSLLNNPRLDVEEVLQIVRSTHASGGVLQRIAEDRRWNQNAEVRASVVRNPKTPTPLAIRLLDTLRTPDLQVLARHSGARETLRRAALKIYLGRLSSH